MNIKEQLEDQKYWDEMVAKDKDRAWIAVFDLQGGPMPTKAVEELDTFLSDLTSRYNLVASTRVE